MASLRDLDLAVFYDAPGEVLARQFLLPALSVSNRYDRVSAYFNLQSLISIGIGLDRLRGNGGRMRLLMGAHDVDSDLAQAAHYATVDEYVGRLRERVLSGATTVRDELERDRIKAAAWMMRDGLLEIRCVGPRSRAGVGGIFHNKRLIFVDANGDMVTATGSPNETKAGLGGNFEELTVHKSWEVDSYTRAHSNRFDVVWAGEDERLATIPLDASFAEDLLRALGLPTIRAADAGYGWSNVVDVLCDSPLLCTLNSSHAPLYPHQERVLTEVCSRWPIRAMLADEVGLGKTFEAAAVISFSIAHAGVSRVVVLAPPTLLRQWQDELASSFGLNFWRYESAARAYFSGGGDRRASSNGPFSGDYPALTIVSRDLARGTRKKGNAFEGAELMPDMLVLDEAHAVRKRRTSTDARPSLLGRMINEVLQVVPHALFLTATPLQVAAEELFDSLELLGVPPTFDEAAFTHSLELLAAGVSAPAELAQAAGAAHMVKALVNHYELELDMFPKEVGRIVTSDASVTGAVRLAKAAQASWPEVRNALVRAHPAATLCVRNTRQTLSRSGYRFPSRAFRSVECSASPDVRRVLDSLDTYLSNHLGMVESALYPDKATAVGFVRSTYRQRAASSLAAVQVSLERRLERLAVLADGGDWTGETEEEDAVDEPEGSVPQSAADHIDARAVQRACSIESADITALLRMLGRLHPDVRRADPKLDSASEIAGEYLAAGKSVLLFSRYTDTVNALISSYTERVGQDAAYAVYTGSGARLRIGSAERAGDKRLVTDALTSGEVQVVFCSDAASEGLNLQAASVLVNVDVPWNPARLEQRIGRIARLGQIAETVDVVNLWYPRSVESKIYERILHRKDLMDLALGAFPELVGHAIKSAVLGPGRRDELDVIEALTKARTSLELEALTGLWSAYSLRSGSVGSAQLRREIAGVLDAIVARVSIETPGDGTGSWTSPDEAGLVGPQFTLHRRWIAWLEETTRPPLANSLRGKLGVLSSGTKPLLFAIRSGTWVKVLSPAGLPDVLRAVYLGAEPDLEKYVYLEFPEGSPTNLARAETGAWWPRPDAMTIPVSDAAIVPPVPAWSQVDGPIFFEPIG